MPKCATIYQYGNYITPQSYSADAVRVALGQWWFDFDVLTTPTIRLFIGTQVTIHSVNEIGTATFGVFILPDGDVPQFDLFDLVLPDLQVVIPGDIAAFTGKDASIVIPRPAGAKQVLVGFQSQHPTTHFSTITTQFRSVIVQASEV